MRGHSRLPSFDRRFSIRPSPKTLCAYAHGFENSRTEDRFTDLRGMRAGAVIDLEDAQDLTVCAIRVDTYR